MDVEALEFARLCLTEKQFEVVMLRAEGLGTRQIARRLLISQSSTINRLDAADLRLRRAIKEREEGRP